MATRKEQIIGQIQRAIDEVPDRLATEAKKAQRKAFESIVEKLARLRLDPDGNIITSMENFALERQLIDELRRSYLSPEYQAAVREFVNQMDEGAALTNRLFSVITGGDINPSAAAQAILQASKDIAARRLTEGAVDFAKDSFEQILNNAIGSSESFPNLVKTIRLNMVGSEDFEGRMERYAKQNAKDIFSVAESEYLNKVSTDLGFEFYEYAGVNIADTREFCEKRKGKIYHAKEIEAWASLDWQGKNRATTAQTIWVYRGGYNCNHVLVPVATEDVPANVIERAIAAGFYTPQENE